MGNCLVFQGESIKIMKIDGQIIEYKAPMRVHQVLLEHPGHQISDSLLVLRQLRPETEMLKGRLYYLLPLSTTSTKVEKKKVRFSDLEKDGGHGCGAVRIKLVISKQELKDMLNKGGVSVKDVTSHLYNKASIYKMEMADGEDNESRVWKPVLESIPEVN